MTIPDAKVKIMAKSPFFGTILFQLPIKETKEIPTLGVDGEMLFYNPDFWNKHPPQQQLALLMHEAGHLFLGHIWRGKDRREIVGNPTTGEMALLYNLAGDYVINLMIKEDPRFQLPKQCLISDKYINWTTEEVYDDLFKNTKTMTPQQMAQLIGNQICDKSGWGKGKRGNEKMRERWERIGKQALEYAQQKGDLPAFLQRYYKLLHPKEDWRAILRNYAQPFNNDYSFSPPDRRFLGEDFILPDIQDGEKIDWIGIAIDTSGSIGEKEINSFLSEVKSIMESFDSVKVKLTFCDANATPLIELTDFDQSKIKVVGGGGTSFKPPFTLIAKEDGAPLLMLYFTDLYGDFPEKAPAYETLWIVSKNENAQVPFGRILPYKI